MDTEQWIKIVELNLDLIKTLVPYGTLVFILWYFRGELQELMRKGSLKLSAGGITLETIKQQKEEISQKEKTKIKKLNEELKTTKKEKEKLEEIQKDTSQLKDTLFLHYHFEKTYRLIFPRQLTILNHMYENDGKISDVLAKTIFRNTIWAKDFGSTYEQFIGFLINSGLASYTQDKTNILITPIGRMFFDYIKTNKILLKPITDDVLSSTVTTTTTTTTS